MGKSLASLRVPEIESIHPFRRVVQIGEIVYRLPEDREEQAPSPPSQFEFIVPVKENSKSAAMAAMEGLYRIVFD